MTRKEAIKNLKELLKWYLEEEWMSETVYKREALDMAISALSEELSEDGTLTVHVSDGSKVKRVFVMGDNIFGGLYYPDSAENKGDLISRQAVLDELEKWDWQELYLPIHFKQILDDVPSVENKGEWIPIEEREPEVHKYVMFTTKTTRREIGYKAKEEPYYFLFGDSGAYVKSDYILAWMELPEPYKGE